MNTADRMRTMTGVECTVWFEWQDARREILSNPSWMKCHIIEEFGVLAAPFLVFDADILPMRPWNPEALYRGRFTGVAEAPNTMIRQECNAYGMRQDRYINGGLLMFDASHRSIWDETWSRHPHYGRWLEQTSLNKSLDGKAVTLLPHAFNTLLQQEGEDLTPEGLKARPEVNLHMCGLRGDIDRLLRVQEELGWG